MRLLKTLQRLNEGKKMAVSRKGERGQEKRRLYCSLQNSVQVGKNGAGGWELVLLQPWMVLLVMTRKTLIMIPKTIKLVKKKKTEI